MQKYKKKIDEILRVNHAGEYGAQVIYKSQIRHSKNKKLKKELEKISQDEIVHFEYFNEMILKNRVRPTIMQPLWMVGGTAIGVLSSLMGEKYVHACTEAIESTIVDHYREQIDYLEKNKINNNLKKKLKKFCDEEDGHKKRSQQKIENEKNLIFFKFLTRNITKVAISISKKF